MFFWPNGFISCSKLKTKTIYNAVKQSIFRWSFVLGKNSPLTAINCEDRSLPALAFNEKKSEKLWGAEKIPKKKKLLQYRSEKTFSVNQVNIALF